MKRSLLLSVGWGLSCLVVVAPVCRGGTLAWWRFETVSSNVLDASAGNHSGVTRNMNAGMDDGHSGYSTDVPGQLITDGSLTNVNSYCLRLDGVNAYVDITNNLHGFSMTNNPSSFTVECFFKLTGATFPMRFLHMNNSTGAAPPATISPHFTTYGTLPRLAMSLNSDLATTYASTYCADMNPSPVAMNTWHHVAYVKTGDSLRFYLDYQYISTYTFDEIAGPYTGFDLVHIGAVADFHNCFNGYLDEMRLSDQALSPAQFLHVVGGLRPAIRAISCTTTSVDLTVVTESGVVYQVQSSAALCPSNAVAWSNATDAVTGSPFYTTMPVSHPGPIRFYRALKNP